MGTLLFTVNGEPLPHSLFAPPPVTHVPWVTGNMPCFPCLSTHFFRLDLPNRHPLPSHLTPPPSLLIQSLWFSTGEKTEPSGMLLFTELSGQGIRAASPWGLGVPSFSPFAEIY